MIPNQVRFLTLAVLLGCIALPALVSEAQEPQETPEPQAEPPPADGAPKPPPRRAGLLPLEQAAEIDLGSRPVGPALLHRRALVLATNTGEVLSLDAATLVTQWKLGMPGADLFTPCVAPSGVLVASRSGTLTLVRPETGEIVNEESIGSPIARPPTCDGGTLFLATPDSEVLAYDLEQWKETWRSKLQAAPLTMTVGHGLLLVSDDAGGLNALEAATGSLRWQFQGRGNLEARAVFDDAGERLYLGDTAGFFYAISVRDGKVHYRWANGAAFADAALLEEDRLFVASYANTLFCYRTGNGHELWRTNLPGRPAGAPLHIRRRIVVLTLNGQVSEYLAGGQPAPLVYNAPDDILPYPTFLPAGMVLPLRSGKLLLLRSREPTPAEAVEPGGAGEDLEELEEAVPQPDELTMS
jgi:outer membrane protein assembly factor BamB